MHTHKIFIRKVFALLWLFFSSSFFNTKSLALGWAMAVLCHPYSCDFHWWGPQNFFWWTRQRHQWVHRAVSLQFDNIAEAGAASYGSCLSVFKACLPSSSIPPHFLFFDTFSIVFLGSSKLTTFSHCDKSRKKITENISCGEFIDKNHGFISVCNTMNISSGST